MTPNPSSQPTTGKPLQPVLQNPWPLLLLPFAAYLAYLMWQLAAYDGRGTRDPFGVARSRLRFAHTSPIYVTVGGRGPLARKSVEEGLRMLDRFDDFAAATAAPAFQDSIRAAVSEARDKLKRRLAASE